MHRAFQGSSKALGKTSGPFQRPTTKSIKVLNLVPAVAGTRNTRIRRKTTHLDDDVTKLGLYDLYESSIVVSPGGGRLLWAINGCPLTDSLSNPRNPLCDT